MEEEQDLHPNQEQVLPPGASAPSGGASHPTSTTLANCVATGVCDMDSIQVADSLICDSRVFTSRGILLANKISLRIFECVVKKDVGALMVFRQDSGKFFLLDPSDSPEALPDDGKLEECMVHFTAQDLEKRSQAMHKALLAKDLAFTAFKDIEGMQRFARRPGARRKSNGQDPSANTKKPPKRIRRTTSGPLVLFVVLRVFVMYRDYYV